MKTSPHPLFVLSLVTLLAASTASAQVAAPVVNGAVGAVGNLGVGGGARPASAAGGLGGGLHGGVAGGALSGGTYHGGEAGSALGFSESLGMKQERLRAEAHASKSAAGRAPGATFGHTVAASVALDAGPTATRVREAAVTAREEVVSLMSKRVDASVKSMVALEAQAAELKGGSRTEFKAALKDAQAREKRLRTSLKAARKASAEAWADSRHTVAADYEAYAIAVTRTETVASAGRARAEAAAAASATAGAKSQK